MGDPGWRSHQVDAAAVSITAGLDVGGAHLKVALVDSGRVIAAEQFRCRLWLGLDKLDTALKKAAPLLARADRFAVTMTGELSDLFASRQDGVETLIARMITEFGVDKTVFWIGPQGFGNADRARANHAQVGSTNFLATAGVAGRVHTNALMIDFGSTTADIIPIQGGIPRPRGLTDGDRQTTGELVYTGYTRTAVMGVVRNTPFKGQWVTLAREYLSTMADVRRILGTLPEGVDLHAAADGKGKSVPESLQRFARMLGRDATDGTPSDWQAAAAFVRETQLRSLHDGALQVLSAIEMPTTAPIIAAGLGSSEVQEVARRLGRTCVSFADLTGATADYADDATTCAPAVAVAILASR
jgi:(4-(4-[2-(gamma-L-glutamylamino)ethyl]phenoxymethyl)furan-2-yl)methanamine synthase